MDLKFRHKEIPRFVTTSMEPYIIVLSIISQGQEDKYHMMSILMCNQKKLISKFVRGFQDGG
jgi:hypothetical protein